MREQLGGAYGIRVDLNSYTLPDMEYLVSVIFGSNPERVDQLFQEVIAEVDWIRQGCEQKYLDTVKEQRSTAREEQLRANGFWLSQIRAAAQRGESLAEIVGFMDRLDAITLEDVAAFAQRYFTPDMYVRVVLLPEEE